MARSLRVIVLLVGVLVMLLAPRAFAQETLAIEVGKKAKLLDGGQAVALQVAVTCPQGGEVLARVSGYLLLTTGESTSPTGVVKLRP